MEQPKKVDLASLSNFVVAYFLNNEIQWNHLKLQKVLYYIQAYHLAYFDDPLFDELPEAWVNGPVYRSVYNRYKPYGARQLLFLPPGEDKDKIYKAAKENLDLLEGQWAFLNAILNHYGLMPHEKLIMLTHSEDPWNNARSGLGPFDYSTNQISLKDMHTYYKNAITSQDSK